MAAATFHGDGTLPVCLLEKRMEDGLIGTEGDGDVEFQIL